MSDVIEKTRMITYFVNGVEQATEERKRTARQILTNAGFTPAEEYELVSGDGGKVLDLEKEEPVHENERFTALFKGATPVSLGR